MIAVFGWETLENLRDMMVEYAHGVNAHSTPEGLRGQAVRAYYERRWRYV